MKKLFLPVVILAALCAVSAADNVINILPGSAGGFKFMRSSAVAAPNGGYTVNMSCDRWAELIWTPPPGVIKKLNFSLKTTSAQKGFFWVLVIDAQGERFCNPEAQNIQVPSTVNGITGKFDLGSFVPHYYGKKFDGKITFPLRSVYIVYYARPVQKDKSIQFQLDKAEAVYDDLYNIMPQDAKDFRTMRSSAVPAADGKGGYDVTMSCDRWAELIWTPPKGEIKSISLDFKTFEMQKGFYWLQVIDAQGERFCNPQKQNIQVPSTVNGLSRTFQLADFVPYNYGKKFDGKITFPLRSIYIIYYARPVQKDKHIKFRLRSVFAEYTSISKPVKLPVTAGAWEVIRHDKALGGITELGDGTLKISKTNAEGILELRLKKGVKLAPGRWFLRSEYQSKRNSGGTLFFHRLVPSATAPANMHPSGALLHSTDSLLVNTAGNSWADRICSLVATTTHTYYPAMLIIGDPAEITIRDLVLDPVEKIRRVTNTPDPKDLVSDAELAAILQQRQNSECYLQKDARGDVQFILNGEVVNPVLYKNEGKTYHHMFRDADFTAAGVPISMIPVPLCHDLKKSDIVLGIGKYDYRKIDEIFARSLRRNPHGNYVVVFSIYEPYIGWGRENWDEIWQNKDGLRGLGNNCHLKFFSNNAENEKFPEKVGYWPSYSSLKWRNDYRRIIGDVVRYIMSRPYGKTVVGFMLGGGDDGQFQYRKDDHSPTAYRAFHQYLRDRYHSVEAMNKLWQSSYPAFEAVKIPVLRSTIPSDVPFHGPGVVQDYRRFQNREGWVLREFFAKSVKDSAGKRVLTMAYAIPDAFQSAGLDMTPSLDILATPQSYPQRNIRYPYSAHPEQTYRLNNKMWINELDLRSWRAKIASEMQDRWMNPGNDPETWKHSHRKTTAVSIANRLGWWYFSLAYQNGRFFDAPEIMAEIKQVQELYRTMRAMPYRPFRPDVCFVADETSDHVIEAYPYAAYGNPNANGNGNGLLARIEAAGVPFDRAYLKDILNNKELQDYKVYVFLHNALVTTQQRAEIDRLLKNRGRTLIWIYSAGYLDEKSKNSANIRKLTGFEVSTDEKFARQSVYSVPGHPLNQGRREVMSYGDMNLALQMPFGLDGIWGSPFQIFYPLNLKPAEIVAEDSTGKPAAGFRNMGDWNSLLLTTPYGITPTLLNSVAKSAGAYRTGKPGHNIVMNGNFVSIHALFDDEYEFHTPPGVSEVIDAESGKVIGKAPCITLNLTCGKTLWLFMR
ncbi:MAG: beta-galactosidase [Lentisphaeria bacterium]|nr:beta-galactosidase [Lentisphaeria bacterium]